MLAAPLSGVFAQEASLGRVLFTAGVTTTNQAGTPWAYVFWQASDRELLVDERFAVTMKEGGPSDPGDFRQVAVAHQVSDPEVVGLLLRRAENLGEDLYALEAAIDEMFSGTEMNTLPLQEKILAVILGAYVDPDDYEKLVFLGRRHPSLAMAMGTAVAVPLGSSLIHTFEVRRYTDGAAGDVLGRVTLDPAVPVLLPAPDRLAEVPDTSPKGDLNIRLRWEEPAALLRLSLLQFGYHVYRLDEATAVAQGWTAGAPPRAAFLQLVDFGSDDAKQVNALPVMYNDEGGTNTFFIADDNDSAGTGVPFTDGSRFYYYVAAADVLGQPGLISTGLLVTVCDRYPPLMPKNLSADVVRDYDPGVAAATNHIRITWRQDPAGDDASLMYYVFKWSSISQMNAAATGSVAGAIAGPIAHLTGEVFNAYTDTNAAADQSTAWYTVQAAEIVACGTNFSGHSAPAYGFIADLDGPESPLGPATINIMDCSPEVVAGQPVYGGSDNGRLPELLCSRVDTNPALQWADFFYYPQGQAATNFASASYLGRVFYADGEADARLFINQSDLAKSSSYTFFCRVGGSDGSVSEPAFSYFDGAADRMVLIPFTASIKCVREIPRPGDDIHHPGGPGFTPGPYVKPEIVFPPITTNALGHQFLLHQQIDGGPVTLIGQFLVESNLIGAVVTLTNNMAGTIGCSEICLFQEEVDENGISSGQVPIGCYRSTLMPPPLPDLQPLEPAGTVSNPALDIAWFCPPDGVERFEVWFGLEDEFLPASIGAGLTTNLAGGPYLIEVEDKVINFGRYQTGRVGHNFGTPDSPDFAVSVPIEPGKTYYIQIHALDACGNRSSSVVLPFGWYPPGSGPDVPWPARPLPTVSGNFHPQLEAVVLDQSIYRFQCYTDKNPIPAVRIGVVNQVIEECYATDCYILAETNNPVVNLFTSSSSGTALLPVMLYRYQVPNLKRSRVSGDIVQVSPLIEEIAYDLVPEALVCDPFIRILMTEEEYSNNENIKAYGIYLIDTQPVVSGASYVYLVVQFDDTGEPVRVIPLDEVTMP